MLLKNDLSKTKKQIQNNIGNKVKLEFNKGRQKSVIGKCVISNTYPSIFTIQLFQGKEPMHTMSFSYVDVLTNVVAITLCD